MGRSFILTEPQRRAVIHYLEHGGVMSPRIRQMRLRARRMDFAVIREDLDILKRLADLKILVGRGRGAEIKGKASIRQPATLDLKGSSFIRHLRPSNRPSKYDAVIDDFLNSKEEDRNVVIADGDSPAKLKAALRERINGRELTGDIRAIFKDGKVYLERLVQ